MAASINYPASLDTDATVGGGNEPDGTTALDATDSGHPKHSVLHQNLGEAIQKIETKVGKTDSTPSANKVLTSSGTGDSAWGEITAAMIASGQSPTFTNITGTLQTVAQPNITSVGTLTSLTVGGDVDINGLVKVNDGSAAAPTFTFDSDEGNGMYLSGTDELSFTTAGTQRVAISSGGNFALETSGATYLAVDPGTGAGVDADWISVFGVSYGLKRNSSLAAEKENISADLGTHLTADMIDSVVPKMWNRITAPGIPEIGPIAEDMDAISPFLAAKSYDANGDPELLGINRNSYLSLMVLAIKDIRTRLAALEG